MFEKIFQVQMYQGTGELKKNFKVQSQVHKWQINQWSNSITSTGVMTPMSNFNHFQLKSSSSVMTLLFKCQSLTIKVKYKCDDLVIQVSITNN